MRESERRNVLLSFGWLLMTEKKVRRTMGHIHLMIRKSGGGQTTFVDDIKNETNAKDRKTTVQCLHCSLLLFPEGNKSNDIATIEYGNFMSIEQQIQRINQSKVNQTNDRECAHDHR